MRNTRSMHFNHFIVHFELVKRFLGCFVLHNHHVAFLAVESEVFEFEFNEQIFVVYF
jgi:hypothetical protein